MNGQGTQKDKDGNDLPQSIILVSMSHSAESKNKPALQAVQRPLWLPDATQPTGKNLLRKCVRRCALLSKSSTKLTLQQRVSLDFKTDFQQCMVPTRLSCLISRLIDLYALLPSVGRKLKLLLVLQNFRHFFV